MRPKSVWIQTLPYLLLALALSGLSGCDSGAPGTAEAAGKPGGNSNGKTAAKDKDPVPVAVAPVTKGSISLYYAATAVLEAESRAEVRSRASGVVRRLLKEEGDQVEEGEVLLVLEDEQQRLEVRQKELAVAQARTEHDRRKTMRAAGVLSDEDYQAATNDLAKAEADLELAKLQLAYRRVAAPLGGQVVRRHVDRGAHVDSGTRLFELMDLTPLLAKVHVPAGRTGYIAPGQEMRLHLGDGVTLVGQVRLVSPIVDESSGTVKVTAAIETYPVGTRPGDFAKVRIETARHDGALLVNSRAIIEEKGERVVFVIVDGKARRRVVEAGFVDGELTEIVDGLEGAEQLIHKGQKGLSDGDPVEVVESPEHNKSSTVG